MFSWFKGSSSVDEHRTAQNGHSRVPDAKGSSQNSHENLRRLHMIFKGEVQGVGFRWNARSCADELGLSGWVRNEWDGSVSMELQGSDAQIAQFFTLFNKHYDRFHISYTIEEKKDIAVLEDETNFSVLFS